VVTDGTVTGHPLDGAHTKVVRLAPTSVIAADIVGGSPASDNYGYCAMPVEPIDSDATGGTFTAHYRVSSATVVSGGSGFAAADSLALPSGAGALTVATVSGSAIATVTIGTAGDYTALFSNPVTATRAAGTGATLTPNYGVDSVTLAAAGTGYTVGDVLTLATSGSATVTVATITGGGGTGPVGTVTVSAAGTGVTALGTTRAVTGGTGTGATFTPKWKVLSVTSSGGSGYNVGDTLIFTGFTATTLPTAHISVATSHAATTVVVDTAGSGITVAGTITTSTAIATFNLAYQLLSVASSGGSGYNVNDNVVFNGMTAVTKPTAHISTATLGAASVVTVDTNGSGITVAATSVGVAGVSEYVARIWDTKLLTVTGHTYNWTRDASVNGSAFILPFS
jgi:hypothetical protein